MKKINIEDLKREKEMLPTSFFDKVQKEVLSQTVKKNQSKRLTRDLSWVIAASIAIIFGSIFSWNNKKTIQENSTSEKKNTIALNSLKKEEAVAISKIENTTEIPTQKVVKKTLYDKKAPSTKIKVEELLNTGDEEYYEKLAINYEQDIYLELY